MIWASRIDILRNQTLVRNGAVSDPDSAGTECPRHATRQSLEIYSRLALADAQQHYDDVIGDFPV